VSVSKSVVYSAAALWLVVTSQADPLRAQEFSNVPGLSGPVGPPPERGARVHDGFYFRVASGFSVYDERLSSGTLRGTPDAVGQSVEGTNRGIAAASDVAIGGTVAPGWVVGGGIYSLDLVASTFRADNAGAALVPDELDPGLRSLSVIGPFVDWYPNVRGGFHAQAALGLATLTPRVLAHAGTERSEYLAVGGALLLGTGYEWWVADEWSIGVVTQLGVRVLRGKDDDGVAWTHVITNSPTLSVSLTYH
jgi:hypothetical protein